MHRIAFSLISLVLAIVASSLAFPQTDPSTYASTVKSYMDGWQAQRDALVQISQQPGLTDAQRAEIMRQIGVMTDGLAQSIASIPQI
ncbi:hypothetical protein BJ742DRAFT_769217 [Cladochytrium replicatum]|nr:hypothetical protein BJ742DRAFT_769217 [Cladochytrium replicatum]